MTKEENQKETNLSISKILAWVLGLLFLIGGFATLLSNVGAGLLSILASFFIFPPAYNFLRKKTKINLSKGLRILIALILIVISASIMGAGESSVKNEDSHNESSAETNLGENTETSSASYQEVFTFSGRDIRKSEPFTISGNRFRVKFDCQGDLCQAWLHKPGNNLPTDLLMNSVGSISDETIIYGSGEYYIDVNSMGAWSFVVEDYK